MNLDFSFTTTELLVGVSAGILFLLALILIGRNYFQKLSTRDLAAQGHHGQGRSPLAARNKYPEADVFRYSPIILRISMIAVLAFVIGAFNWTVYEKQIFIPDDALAMDFDIEVEKPRTAEPPPPPPPPPPPKIAEVAVLDVDDLEDVVFQDQSIDADTYVDAPVAEKKEVALPPPPPPPPPKEEEVKEIFKVVEDMPRFPGCEDMSASKDEIRACSNRKMLEFIYENIKYPAIARDNNIEGTVVISFVVDDKGRINDAQIVREIGGGCGAEALRVVNMMNDLPQAWTPGKQRGRAVNVLFNLPVKFKLQIN